jgi:hypothetical protein
VRALAFAYAAVPLTSDLAIARTRDALRASETVNRGYTEVTGSATATVGTHLEQAQKWLGIRGMVRRPGRTEVPTRAPSQFCKLSVGF